MSSFQKAQQPNSELTPANFKVQKTWTHFERQTRINQKETNERTKKKTKFSKRKTTQHTQVRRFL